MFPVRTSTLNARLMVTSRLADAGGLTTGTLYSRRLFSADTAAGEK